MTQAQHIQQDSTSSILVYPPERNQGAPTSATVRVETPKQSMQVEADAEAATVDAVSASTNAAGDAGDLTMAFASDPTCVAGRLYLVTDVTTGARFRVECRKTGATLHLANGLPMAIGSGSTIVGLAITHALTATETEDAGQGNTIVNATINGNPVEWFHPFRVVARSVAYTLNATRLQTLEPAIYKHQPEQDDDWSETIEAAWSKFVYTALATRGYRPERIVSWPLLEPWHASACMVHVMENNPAAQDTDKDRSMAMMNMLGERALESVDAWYDASDEAGPDGPPEDTRVLVSRWGR